MNLVRVAEVAAGECIPADTPSLVIPWPDATLKETQ